MFLEKTYIPCLTLAVIVAMMEISPANAMFRRSATLIDSLFTKRTIPMIRGYTSKTSYPIALEETEGYTPPAKTQAQLNEQSFYKLPKKRVFYLDKHRERFIELPESSDMTSGDFISDKGDTLIFKSNKDE